MDVHKEVKVNLPGYDYITLVKLSQLSPLISNTAVSLPFELEIKSPSQSTCTNYKVEYLPLNSNGGACDFPTEPNFSAMSDLCWRRQASIIPVSESRRAAFSFIWEFIEPIRSENSILEYGMVKNWT